MGAGTSAPREAVFRQRLDLLTELVRHDVAVAYQGSLLGIAWSQVSVIVQFVVLSVLFTQVVDLGIEHYPAFLFAGLVAWQLFTTGVTAATQSLVAGRELFRTPFVPGWMLPTAAVGAAVARFALSVPLLLVVVWFVTGRLPLTLLLVPVVAVVQVLLLAGPGILLAAAHVRWRDVGHLVTVGLIPLFYATPVFYPPDRVPDSLSLLVTLNPMAHVIDAWRDVLVEGRWPGPELAAVAAVSVLVTLLALVVLERVRPRLVDLL